MLYILDGAMLGLIAGIVIYLLANKILSDNLARIVWFAFAIAIYVIASHIAKLNRLPEITGDIKVIGIIVMFIMFGLGVTLTKIISKKLTENEKGHPKKDWAGRLRIRRSAFINSTN